MTNREVEKRFLFDLEMGIYNAIDNIDYIWFETNSELRYKSLCELLNYLGFRTLDDYRPFYGERNKFVYIGIQIKNKIYSVYIRNIQLKDLVINPLPDYISEYSIRDNW